MSVYYLPLGKPFLRYLAEGILERWGHQPLRMGEVIVLLPTRRGCLSLKEIFQEKAKHQALILPKIYALADLEQDPILPGLLPKPLARKIISKSQRMGHLTQLVQQFLQQRNLCDTVSVAYPLAQELATLLDEFYISNVDLAQLETLAEDHLSLFWQQNLAFLKIISHYWPAILQEKGYCEAAPLYQENLRYIADHWRPSTPVILAGTTGTRPATADLAKSIIGYPQGMVVLPGFEPRLPADLPITHPHYTLYQFVDHLGVAPSTIQPWLDKTNLDNPKAHLLKEAMASVLKPSDQLSPLRADECPIEMIPCANGEEEAAVIAALLRQVYEREEGTATVITPDQALTRRIQAYLQRWDIEINVSSGTPLPETVVGTFLLLLARVHSTMSVTDWVALLKHPLFLKTHDRAWHLQNVRTFEKDILRRQQGKDFLTGENLPEELQAWHQQILEILNPFLTLKGPLLFSQWIEHHLTLAIHLAGESFLWANNDGETAHTFFAELQADPPPFPSLTLSDYAALLGQLMQQVTVHRKEGIGSPLKILGTLEARQAEADVMILAGLNENSWPSAVEEGAWLSNQMRMKLGLPSVYRRLGLAAHDFCLGFSAPTIYLTRCEQQNGSATLPSRLWLRVQTLLQQYGLPFNQAHDLKKALHYLDHSPAVYTPEAPCPTTPHAFKPKHYSVTDIERLLRDPYSIYAKSVLKLKKLNPLDQTLSPREWGQLLHHILEKTFTQHHPRQKETFLSALQEIGHQLFTPYLSDAVVRTFWWHHFIHICQWIDQLEDLHQIHSFYPETAGQIELMVGDEKIILKTIADRIDHLPDGSCQIIDYKTGSLPTDSDISLGFSPQLVLEGLILKANGFPSLQAEQVNAVYWELKGGQEGSQIKPIKNYPTLVEQAHTGLNSLLTYFHHPDALYLSCPWGEEKVRFHDYRHLARVEEWT